MNREDTTLIPNPGIIFSAEGADPVPFLEVTQFGAILTAHSRGKKTLYALRNNPQIRQDETVSFITRDGVFETRPFIEDDGITLSRYSMLLPTDALEGLVTNGNEMDTPETLTMHVQDNELLAITYENNIGRWMRFNFQWLPLSPGDNSLSVEGAETYEVNPEKAADLIDAFDEKNLTEDEALAYGLNETDGEAPAPEAEGENE